MNMKQKVDYSILIHAKLCVDSENLAEIELHKSDVESGRRMAHGKDLVLISTAFDGSIKKYQETKKHKEKEKILTDLRDFLLRTVGKFEIDASGVNTLCLGKHQAYTDVSLKLDTEVRRLEARLKDTNFGKHPSDRKGKENPHNRKKRNGSNKTKR